MTVTCPKCGKEIKNSGALRMHEAHCKGTGSTGESTGEKSREDPSTTVKASDSGQPVDSTGQSTGENKKGFFQGIEDELNA